MSTVRLGVQWVSELRDLFLARGTYVLSEGQLWELGPDMLWRAQGFNEAAQLVSAYLDQGDFVRPAAGGSLTQVLNNQNTRKELRAAVWDHAPLWRHGFFNDAPPGLAVGREWIAVVPEGIYRTPLTGDHKARHALQMELPTNAAPPGRYLEALGRMFGPEEIAAFQEFLGACRTGLVTNYERAVIMPGGGNNGKSTIIMGAVESLFGPHEVRSIVPNFLNQEYHLMSLRGAAINAVTELPKEQVNCTERFKQVISGEDVTGRPIREMPVTFRPSAGHIFACNNFPKLSDNSKGMWRRLLVLRADATFAKSDGIRADLVEAFRAEAPQILLWVLEGARRLLQQGNYTFPKSHYAEEGQWRGSNDKSLQFVTDCTKGFGSGWTKAGAAHKAYLDWHSRKGFSWQDRLDAGAFGAALRHLEGFHAKRQSYGMAYNFIVKPPHEWRDVFLGDEGTGEVTLEDEVS